MSITSFLLPGYTLQGLFQETGANVLYRAVRAADGLPVIVKTPRSWHPGPRERARYEHEYDLLRHLKGAPGVLTVHAHGVF
ncbi:MAG TPA: hypothetical protein VE057_07785, partial [Archangium sp.]|nr:hypothetical protein [Archangium sp.]